MDPFTSDITVIHRSEPSKFRATFSCATQTYRSFLISQRRCHKILEKMLLKSAKLSKRNTAKQLNYSSEDDFIKERNNPMHTMMEKSESNLNLPTDSSDVKRELMFHDDGNPNELRLYGGTDRNPKVRCKIRQRLCKPMHRLKRIRELYHTCTQRISKNPNTTHLSRYNTDRYFGNANYEPTNNDTISTISSNLTDDAPNVSETPQAKPVMYLKSVLKPSSQTVKQYPNLNMNQYTGESSYTNKSNASFSSTESRRSVSFNIPTSSSETSIQSGATNRYYESSNTYEKMPYKESGNYTAFMQPQHTQMLIAATNQPNQANQHLQSLETKVIPRREPRNDTYLRSTSPTSWTSYNQQQIYDYNNVNYDEEDVQYDSEELSPVEDISSEELVQDSSDLTTPGLSSDETLQDVIVEEIPSKQAITYDYAAPEISQGNIYPNTVAESTNAQPSSLQYESYNQISNENNFYETHLEHSKDAYSTDLFVAPNENYDKLSYKYQHTSTNPYPSYNYKNDYRNHYLKTKSVNQNQMPREESFNKSNTLNSQVQVQSRFPEVVQSKKPQISLRPNYPQVTERRNHYQVPMPNKYSQASVQTKGTQAASRRYLVQPEVNIYSRQTQNRAYHKETQFTSKQPQSEVYNKQPQAKVYNKQAQIAVTSKQPHAAVCNKEPQINITSKQTQPIVFKKQPQVTVTSKQPQVTLTSKQHQNEPQVGLNFKQPQISLYIKPIINNKQLQHTVDNNQSQATYCKKDMQFAVNLKQTKVASNTNQRLIPANSKQKQLTTNTIQLQPTTKAEQLPIRPKTVHNKFQVDTDKQPQNKKKQPQKPKDPQFRAKTQQPEVPAYSERSQDYVQNKPINQQPQIATYSERSQDYVQAKPINQGPQVAAYSKRPKDYVQTKPISINEKQSKYDPDYDYSNNIKKLTKSIKEIDENFEQNVDFPTDLNKHKNNIKYITTWSKETLLPQKFSLGTIVCANAQTSQQYPRSGISQVSSANSLSDESQTYEDYDYDLSIASTSSPDIFSQSEMENIDRRIRKSEATITNKMRVARNCAKLLIEQQKSEPLKTFPRANYVPLSKSETLKTLRGQAAEKPTTTKDISYQQTKQSPQQTMQDISVKSVNDRDWKTDSKVDSSRASGTKVFTGKEGKDLEVFSNNILKAYTTLKSYGGDELLSSVFTEFTHLYNNSDKKTTDTMDSGNKSKYYDDFKAKLFPSTSKNIDAQIVQKDTVTNVVNILEAEKILQKCVTEAGSLHVNESKSQLENDVSSLVDTGREKDVTNTKNIELKINKAIKTSSASISIRNEVKGVYNVELTQKNSSAIEDTKRTFSEIAELSKKNLKKPTENKETNTTNDDKKRLFYVIDEEKYRQIIKNEIDILDAININAYIRPEKITFNSLCTKPDFLIQKSITQVTSEVVLPKSEEAYIPKHKHDIKRLNQLEKKIKQISEEIGRYKSLLTPEKNVNMQDIEISYHIYDEDLESSSGGISVVESQLNQITVQQAVIDSYRNIPEISKLPQEKKGMYNTKTLEKELQSIITPKTSNVFKSIDFKIETDTQMANKFYDSKPATVAISRKSSATLKSASSKNKEYEIEAPRSNVKSAVPTPKTSGSRKSTLNKQLDRKRSEKENLKHESKVARFTPKSSGILKTESRNNKATSLSLYTSNDFKNVQSDSVYNLYNKGESSDVESTDFTSKSSTLKSTKEKKLLSLFTKETLTYLSETQSVTSNSSIAITNIKSNREFAKYTTVEDRYSDTEPVTPKSSDLSKKLQVKQKIHYTFSKEENHISMAKKQVVTPKSSFLFKSKGVRPIVCQKVDSAPTVNKKRFLTPKSSKLLKCDCKLMEDVEYVRAQKLFTLMNSRVIENPLEKFSLISMFMDFQDALKDCRYCKDKQAKVLNEKVFEEILRIIKDNDPASVVLTINLHSNALYHINVGLPECDKSLGCLYATEKGIKEAARDENAFEEFITFFVANEGKSMDLKLKALDHSFDAVVM